MKSKLFRCLSTALLGAAVALPTPVLAFRGGGGFHGGFSGFHGGFSGFRGGMITGRSVFVPGGARFAASPFVGHGFGHRFGRFNRFGAVGVPAYVGWGLGWPNYSYAYDYGGYGCWQQVLTTYGWQWAYLC